MLLHIREVLRPAEVARAREILAEAPWGDGRITAGSQSAQAKNNEQLPEACEATQAVQQLLLRGLERHQTFFSAALPKQISPPLFNRYGGAANSFGNHVDSAVRYLRNGAGRVRTDVSCTLFLSEPDEYDGGELMVEDTFGEHRVKLPAGDLVLYPGTSVHRVEPVTRGYRVASYFWIQSMVRSDEQRRLLFEMDNHLRRLRSADSLGETDPSVIGLTSTYHNLLRMWLDV
ncbi:Fe2+-dependent dioxygenase [Xylophilus sp. ASV27]|uniref:Fe2+-dependent dioxygenase n=1 Tax=Xylophilus sp. ASV27 TaxID=2795129 RepID=UPI0018EC7545|nr:Fe2+-dependent dioxygenase [Xylophilus sp. ASV27]